MPPAVANAVLADLRMASDCRWRDRDISITVGAQNM
jgi:hypothetical protein